MTSVTGPSSIPSFLSAIDSARQGIQTGVRNFDEVAASVASATTAEQGPSATDAVNAITARNQVAVSARVFAAADQMLGTILNLRA